MNSYTEQGNLLHMYICRNPFTKNVHKLHRLEIGWKMFSLFSNMFLLVQLHTYMYYDFYGSAEDEWMVATNFHAHGKRIASWWAEAGSPINLQVANFGRQFASCKLD
jgi:hypothetical protein